MNETEQDRPAAEGGGQAQAPVNILLVDDRPENLLALEAMLKYLGHHLVSARSGTEALKRLLERDFALILLDVQMPEMDGFETAALIRQRERSRHTPIIFLTALSKGDIQIFKGYSVGAVDYILKPVVPDILRAKVQIFVELYSMSEQIKEQARGLSERALQLDAANSELSRRASELARSNADLEQFAYVASHDLREPLRKVVSFVRLFEQRYRGRVDAEADEYIRYIVGGVERMEALIADLLEYSRVGREEHPLERVECAEALRHALMNLATSVEESGAVVESGDLPTVAGRPAELVQLFQNLVGNAVKFRGQEPPRVRISARRRNGSWLFRVEDNGIGIDPKHHERVFALFKRLHGRSQYPGTGIGLAICKKVVESHGGRIWIESAAGRGTAFCFTLPGEGEG